MQNNLPTCRVCLQSTSDFFEFNSPINSDNRNNTGVTFLEFFCECTRIEVEPYELGSECFCLPCGEELRSFYKFVKIAEMNDCILKERIVLEDKQFTASEIIVWEPESEDICTLDNGLRESGESNPEIRNNISRTSEIEYFRETAKFVSDPYPNISNEVLIYETDVESVDENLIKIINKNSKENHRKYSEQSLTELYGKGPSECAFCHEILRNQKALDKHLIDEHQRRSQPCKVCGKMVIRLREHLLIHFRERNNLSRPKAECPICFRKISKQTLSRHMRLVHKREFKNQTCSLCCQTFADAHKLGQHIKKGHHSNNNFNCSLCTRTFSKRVSLNNHLRIHFI